jgi:hypothetical protein
VSATISDPNRPSANTIHGTARASEPTSGCRLDTTSSHLSAPTVTVRVSTWPVMGSLVVVVERIWSDVAFEPA